MRNSIIVCAAMGVGGLACDSSPALDESLVRSNGVQEFATLPDDVRFPEGIAANPDTGDIYVATFDTGPNPNKLLRYDRDGQLAAQSDFGATPLLGLAFNAADQSVYIANFGASKIQRIAAAFDDSTAVEDVATVPGIGAPAERTEPNPDGSSDTITFGSNSFPAPNALTFDSQGNLLVSDSFQGAVFRIDDAAGCEVPCEVTTVVQDPLLATAGFPPFGANGLALDQDETALFIANTGDDRILRVDLAAEPPTAPTVFAESINGADGIAFDDTGRLWIAANQADEVVALNENGRPVVKLGEFQGIRRDGSPAGLLFPASIVLVGDSIFVTNAALALTPAEGDEPEEDVTRFTVSSLALPR